MSSSSTDESSEDDDIPLRNLRTGPPEDSDSEQKFQTTQEDDDSDSSDDDDVPLSQLKSNSPPPKKKKAVVKKKKAVVAKKKVKTVKKKMAATKKSSVGSSTASTGATAAEVLYANCDKGKLIQRLLCRWWYAVEWPDPAVCRAGAIPPNCDALDGFPGVYVCIRGSEVGTIHDKRDATTCPNFYNYARKSSEELQELIGTAISKQREELIASEGPGTSTQAKLDKLQTWAQKLKPIKLDKEAAKVLKAARITLF
eukprot:scaffold78480_cov60-Attheya_sp.AAC.3